MKAQKIKRWLSENEDKIGKTKVGCEWVVSGFSN